VAAKAKGARVKIKSSSSSKQAAVKPAAVKANGTQVKASSKPAVAITSTKESSSVFYTLSHETTWSKWGQSGHNGVDECNTHVFWCKLEPLKHSPTLLSYYSNEFEMEEDNRETPPDDGLIIEFHNDGEVKTVHIEKHVTVFGKATSPSNGLAFYKLRMDFKSSKPEFTKITRCNLVFLSPSEAANYAETLINRNEIGDGPFSVDKRKNGVESWGCVESWER
jgi:hypothetical protein